MDIIHGDQTRYRRAAYYWPTGSRRRRHMSPVNRVGHVSLGHVCCIVASLYASSPPVVCYPDSMPSASASCHFCS
jgi:hypothetical protein